MRKKECDNLNNVGGWEYTPERGYSMKCKSPAASAGLSSCYFSWCQCLSICRVILGFTNTFFVQHGVEMPTKYSPSFLAVGFSVGEKKSSSSNI